MFAKLTPVASAEAALKGSIWDAFIIVAPHFKGDLPGDFGQVIQAALKVDATIERQAQLLVTPSAPGSRLITSPTGPLVRDYDDVRRIGDAAAAGIRRARAAGSTKPCFLFLNLPGGEKYTHGVEVGLLQAMGALWEPLEARESLGEDLCEPVSDIGFITGAARGPAMANFISAVEKGRRLARDIGGTEPERMSPIEMANICEKSFRNSAVTCEINTDIDAMAKDYPLLHAVARASLSVPRHHPRVIRLTYEGQGPITETLLLAGKGLSYDTGGADLKAGGHMAGMSRDKGGGAAVAGFLKAVAEIQPKGLRVIAEIGAVRNSIGADSFVADEIIKSHAGTRVRIGNTDAEGRLVLADLLSHLREDALNSVNPRLFTVATLTGHSVRAVGPYTITMDNAPALDAGISQALSDAGDLWGDCFSISRLRREDFDFVRPRTKADDVLSCNNLPSSGTPRGHQFPMAFLTIASGLQCHGGDAQKPLAYTHIDCGGSALENSDWQHGRPTGSPVLAFAAHWLR